MGGVAMAWAVAVHSAAPIMLQSVRNCSMASRAKTAKIAQCVTGRFPVRLAAPVLLTMAA